MKQTINPELIIRTLNQKVQINIVLAKAAKDPERYITIIETLKEVIALVAVLSRDRGSK